MKTTIDHLEDKESKNFVEALRIAEEIYQDLSEFKPVSNEEVCQLFVYVVKSNAFREEKEKLSKGQE